jgi:hypothetical protein
MDFVSSPRFDPDAREKRDIGRTTRLGTQEKKF